MKWLKAMALALLAILAAELAAAPHFRESPGLFREDPLRFWAMNPSTTGYDHQSGQDLHVNAAGLRGPELPPAEAGPRMLLLGDSCAYGAGVADAEAPDRPLEAALRRRSDRAWHVANGGTPGYTTFQELHLLEEVAPTVRPEVLVVTYTVADSSREMTPDHLRHPEALAPLRALLWRSRLYRVLRAWKLGREVDAVPPPQDMLRLGAAERVPVEQYVGNLERMAALARQYGARAVVFVRLPNLTPPNLQHIDHLPAFRKVAEREGVFVDLYQDWADRGLLTEEMFLPNDVLHFSVEGSRQLGESLAEALVREGVVR